MEPYEWQTEEWNYLVASHRPTALNVTHRLSGESGVEHLPATAGRELLRLAEENRALKARENRKSAVLQNRLDGLLCPDHRDKAPGGECVICALESEVGKAMRGQDRVAALEETLATMGQRDGEHLARIAALEAELQARGPSGSAWAFSRAATARISELEAEVERLRGDLNEALGLLKDLDAQLDAEMGIAPVILERLAGVRDR